MKSLLLLFIIWWFINLSCLAQNSTKCDICSPLEVIGVPAVTSCFWKMYVFGDSLEDTGNLAATFPGVLTYPYGITNPGCPKGRFSDGALLVDFIAHAFKLPTTVPFEGCPCGTNFAFAGATVLSNQYYEERGLQTFVPVSFLNETEWFIAYKHHCLSELEKGLFVVGGGGDDYIVETLAGYSPSQIINSTVPLVVAKIVKTIQFFISNGAKDILVLNVPQPSCTPLYLDVVQDPEGVDQFGCLKGYGRVVTAHNLLLFNALSHMLTPRHVSIAIGDRYTFLYDVLAEPTKYGFVDTHDACCGGGGQHNGVNPCGPGASLCGNPNLHVYFDRVHFTEEFNRQEARAFIYTKKYIIWVKGAPTQHISLVDLCKPAF